MNNQSKGFIQERASMIATYALCGFSNLMSAGIELSVIGDLAPSKRDVISKVVLRALMAGSIACFMSATLAGILLIFSPTFFY